MKIEFEKYKTIIETFNKVITDEGKLDEIINILEEADINIRQCSSCNKLMVEGYVIENGEEYYCCDKCLESNMTREEFEELYNDGEGDSYFTQWE